MDTITLEAISSESFDLKFPRDHNAHITNLKQNGGILLCKSKKRQTVTSFGIQWTLFKEADQN